MIWLVFALLAGAAVMSVLAPLARKARASDPAGSDVAFFKQQIRDIEGESADGRLAPEDAETAKIEAARRLLRAQSSPDKAAVSSRRNATIAALAAIVLIPALSLFLYSRLGHSNMPDAPLQARLDAAPRTDMAGAVARIEAHLAEHPDDGRGFEVVAPFYLSDGRTADAVHAFSEALRLLGATAQRHAALGEARVFLSQGAVSAEARRDFEAALALDPSHKMSRYYLGLVAAQNGEREKATDIWSKLLSEAPPGAPWSERLRAQLDQLQGATQAQGAGQD
ncbi:MAG: c-type cytochrome biogenesis protein CcmI [Methylocystis sp.]|nr:c-type cytochrome biogenesis protein CcmI [Methylocystis sp.]